MSANYQETNSTTETPGLDPFLELMTAMRIDFSPTEQGRTMVAEWVAHIRGLDEPTGKAEKLASYIERYLITEPQADRATALRWYIEHGIDPETGEDIFPAQGPTKQGDDMSTEPTQGVTEATEAGHQLQKLLIHIHAIHAVMCEATDVCGDDAAASKLLLAGAVLGQVGKEVDLIAARLADCSRTGLFDEATIF